MIEKNLLTEKTRKFKITTMALCEYCHFPYKKSKLIKCSMDKCTFNGCIKCMTVINGKPFCHDCVIDIVRNKSVLIITKGEI